MPKQDDIFIEGELEHCPLDKLKIMLENTPLNADTVNKYVQLLNIILDHEKYIRRIRQNLENHLREYNIQNMMMDVDN
jgi:hypothetical protein